MQTNFAAVLTAASALAGVVFGYFGYRRGLKKDGEKDGELKSDTEYIKMRIDDVLLEQKDTNKSLISLSERVTRVEESAKQAHKRIDGLEHRMDCDE